MKQYWQNLNDRERKLVLLAAVALVIAVFYAGIYEPLHTRLVNKNKLLLDKQQTLKWMQSISPTINNKNKAHTISNNQLLTLISQELKQAPFKKFPFQAQQSTNGEIQLSFEKAPYLPLIKWLWSLQNRYAIDINQVNIEKSEKPGITRCMILLTANKNP